jgi:hypothetical protein
MFIRVGPGGARLLRCAHRLGGPWRLPENVGRNESQLTKNSLLRYTLAGPFRQGFRAPFRCALVRLGAAWMALGGADSSHETTPESPPSTSRKSARSAGATSGRKNRSGLVVVTKTWLAVSFKNS